MVASPTIWINFLLSLRVFPICYSGSDITIPNVVRVVKLGEPSTKKDRNEMRAILAWVQTEEW